MSAIPAVVSVAIDSVRKERRSLLLLPLLLSFMKIADDVVEADDRVDGLQLENPCV